MEGRVPVSASKLEAFLAVEIQKSSCGNQAQYSPVLSAASSEGVLVGMEQKVTPQPVRAAPRNGMQSGRPPGFLLGRCVAC